MKHQIIEISPTDHNIICAVAFSFWQAATWIQTLKDLSFAYVLVSQRQGLGKLPAQVTCTRADERYLFTGRSVFTAQASK